MSAACSVARFWRASSSSLARAFSSASRCSRSLASASSRRRFRSSSRAFSSASRWAASSASRALAAASAFIRRSSSASEIPAGRLDALVIPEDVAEPAAPVAAAGLGTTTRLRLVSTTTFLVLPWLKLCFTFPGREPAPRTPKGFFPSLSLIVFYFPFRRAVSPSETRRPFSLAASSTTRCNKPPAPSAAWIVVCRPKAWPSSSAVSQPMKEPP